MATPRRTSSGVFIKSDESVSDADRNHNFTMGDLGFGLGLKPGAVAMPAIPGNGGGGDHGRILSLRGDDPFLLESSHNLTRRHSAPQEIPDGGDDDEKQPKRSSQHFYDDQRGKGFLSGLRTLMLRTALRHVMVDSNGSGDRENGLWTPKHQNEVFTRLEAATQEATVLQSELEAARRHLDSKYRAIKILQSQFAHAIMINKEKTRSIQQAGNMKKSLEHELNSLQFDLSTSKDCAMLSQQTWAQRFDRVCMENETLVATLRARSDQVRRTQLEKNALRRERDELIAMMDAKERLQYDRHKSSTNDAYLHNSLAQQFAVLGACLCRGSKPEPCGCARAAARLKKENDQLKDEVDQLGQNLEAATMKADSFLTAFDNQLDQNSLLGQQITRACRGDEKRLWGRSKSNHRWKKPVCENGFADGDRHQRSRPVISGDGVESEQLASNHREAAGCRSVAVQVSEPLPDLISTLADLLNDKTEALAHQRLVAKMLARKTQDLERMMEQLNEYNKR